MTNIICHQPGRGRVLLISTGRGVQMSMMNPAKRFRQGFESAVEPIDISPVEVHGTTLMTTITKSVLDN
ncbi:hypothetical protein AV530_011934 [Patagioenas fasciata monilis]|uniref:Uncharacterized protein n=1 Tax=Patagioenas fasciata monilis TaxID=372326 RepID=A0A1V4JUD1_PATFA|nr:hypothetical protein AV530_011934 [Patagioenas fasciata monilis]